MTLLDRILLLLSTPLSLWHLVLILIVMDFSVDGLFHDVSTRNKPPVEYLRMLK